MKYHELKAKSSKKARRVGRGTGSGRGKTAGRGTKGQNARTGGGTRPGFEGGQNPLLKRIPKSRGFKSNRAKPAVVHTDQLNQFKAGSVVDKQALISAGLVSDKAIDVKLLNRGKLEKSLKVSLAKMSKTAKEAIESAGGSIEKVKTAEKPKKTEESKVT